MDGIQLAVSLLSGGLAGGCVSTIANRIFYRRSLRTKFHPKLNNIFGTYFTRMENQEGRYWVGRIGYLPSFEDQPFVSERTTFVMDLSQFNELKEARKLRRQLTMHPNPEGATTGTLIKTDLLPEYEAISDCLDIVQKKLKL